jgi:hypothetical protein
MCKHWKIYIPQWSNVFPTSNTYATKSCMCKRFVQMQEWSIDFNITGNEGLLHCRFHITQNFKKTCLSTFGSTSEIISWDLENIYFMVWTWSCRPRDSCSKDLVASYGALVKELDHEHSNIFNIIHWLIHNLMASLVEVVETTKEPSWRKHVTNSES